MQLTEAQEVTMRIARKGYEGYCAYTGNKSVVTVVTGGDLPHWEDLPGAVRKAWFHAAEAMIDYTAELERQNLGEVFMQVDYNYDTSIATVTRNCPFCGKEQTMQFNINDFEVWRSGVLIQNAMPNATPDEREFLMTGICNKCFPSEG